MHYTSTQSGNFNDPNTWGGGGWPSANGDTFTVTAGHTVTVNGDFSGVDLGASTIDGLLIWATNANTALQISGMLTTSATGERRAGNSGSCVGAAYTARLLFNPAADNTRMLHILAGGKDTMEGDPLFNMPDESKESLKMTLAVQANSGQKDVVVTDATAAAALRASGDFFALEGTTSWSQTEEVEVAGVSGTTITLTQNLTHSHAAGASLVHLSKNVSIESVDVAKRGYIDDDNTTGANTNWKHAMLKDIHTIYGTSADLSAPTAWSYLSLWGTNRGFRAWHGPLTLSESVLFTPQGYGASTYAMIFVCYGNILIKDCIISTHEVGAVYGTMRFKSCKVFGCATGIEDILHGNIEDCAFDGNRFPIHDLDCVITNCTFGKDFANSSSDVYLGQGDNMLFRYCKFYSPVFIYPGYDQIRGKMWSQDHNQVIGAGFAHYDNIGSIERQNTVARSGYAAEIIPKKFCSSDEPFEIEWDISCTHGDVIAVEVYVRVNAAYGTSHDPTLILDPDSIYGCNNTSSENVTAADTWTKLTATGTADLGGVGVKGVVNVKLQVDHYVNGGKVFADDLAVDLNSARAYECDFSTSRNGLPMLALALGGGEKSYAMVSG